MSLLHYHSTVWISLIWYLDLHGWPICYSCLPKLCKPSVQFAYGTFISHWQIYSYFINVKKRVPWISMASSQNASFVIACYQFYTVINSIYAWAALATVAWDFAQKTGRQYLVKHFWLWISWKRYCRHIYFHGVTFPPICINSWFKLHLWNSFELYTYLMCRIVVPLYCSSYMWLFGFTTSSIIIIMCSAIGRW